MTDTTKTIAETMEDLAETIRKVPQEKQGEVNAFMAGYLAGLEHMLTRQETKED